MHEVQGWADSDVSHVSHLVFGGESMNKKVKELVEWVDKELRYQMITIGTSVEDAKTGQMWAYDSESLTKIILSHPDLALIDRDNDEVRATEVITDSDGFPIQWIPLVAVIPLVEALKEVKE